MTTGTFIIKTAIKLIILTTIIAYIICFLDVCGVIISNNIALGQMENSDSAYVFMELYNNTIKPCSYGLITLIILYGVGSIGYNAYKFIKTKTKEKN